MFKSLPKKSITCFSGGLIVFGRHMNLIILTDLLKDPLIHPSILCWIWFIAFAMPVSFNTFFGSFLDFLCYILPTLASSLPPIASCPVHSKWFRTSSKLTNGSHIFFSGQGSLDQKGNSIFQIVRCEMPLVAPPKSPPPSWANQLPNVLASKFWSQHGMYRAGGTDHVWPPSRFWHLSREQ